VNKYELVLRGRRLNRLSLACQPGCQARSPRVASTSTQHQQSEDQAASRTKRFSLEELHMRCRGFAALLVASLS